MADQEYTARCMKCQEERKVNDPNVETPEKGARRLTGTCAECGTKVFKFLPREA